MTEAEKTITGYRLCRAQYYKSGSLGPGWYFTLPPDTRRFKTAKEASDNKARFSITFDAVYAVQECFSDGTLSEQPNKAFEFPPPSLQDSNQEAVHQGKLDDWKTRKDGNPLFTGTKL